MLLLSTSGGAENLRVAITLEALFESSWTGPTVFCVDCLTSYNQVLAFTRSLAFPKPTKTIIADRVLTANCQFSFSTSQLFYNKVVSVIKSSFFAK